MHLFNPKKLQQKQAKVGTGDARLIGSQTKLTNYEYGRQKAKKIAMSRALTNKKK